jgi:hypothetical protein
MHASLVDNLGGTVTPRRVDLEGGRRVGDRNVSAKLIHRQPLYEVAGFRACDVEQVSVSTPNDEKVEQDFALRRQQPRMSCFTFVKALNVVGNQALQQFFAVASCHADDAAIGKSRYLCGRHD